MKAKIYLLLLTTIALAADLQAQNYNDYVGAGHNVGITITASSSEANAGPEKTMDASGMLSPYFSAGRFLSQATMGATKAEIDHFYGTYGDNYETWIDEQFLIPYVSLEAELEDIWYEIFSGRVALGQDSSQIFGPYTPHFNYAYHHEIFTEGINLRHRVTQALSQILVVSINSDINDWGEAQAMYYDLLQEHTFGNYKDLLMDITYSFPMAYYLSHYNNPKEIPEENVHPDENYAREIMQLFTIGLYELNADGTRVLDADGDPIPTYGQDEIKEMAQVFTGLGPGEIYEGLDWPPAPFFGLDNWAVPKNSMLTMYNDWHDTSEKVLLNGYTIPAGQSGDMDIEMAVDHLFNHQNVGPFIGRQLIQRLVKSNPTPEYVGRVAAAFADNGSGVRGDMKAVIKAVLLDEEARSGEYMLAMEDGRLKEPMLRILQAIKAIGTSNVGNRYWHTGWSELNEIGQNILAAPSVFNFYAPDYIPNGELKDEGLVAPEFALHNTSKAVTTINRMYGYTFWDGYGGSWENYNADWNPYGILTEDESTIRPTRDWLHDFASDPERLVTELDKVFTYGQMSDDTRANIKAVVSEIDWPWDIEEQNEWRTRLALYMVQMSPDFTVIK